MRGTALFATVAILLTLLVSHCAGRPWHQRRQQRQRPSVSPTRPAVAVTSASIYAEYDDPSVAVNGHPPPSDQSLQQQESPEPDYGEPGRMFVEPERVYAEPEQNYEVDEAVSVLSDGRVHGVQLQPTTTTTAVSGSYDASSSTTDSGSTDIAITGFTATSSAITTTTISTTTSSTTTTTTQAVETRKSGYVVDGKHYRKYRVEEETPDGFIVGEYGVVSHHDGTTRGVRYTADSSINPRVIYEALAKFLALRRRR
ncbi:uncharacterized protein LOC100159791 [Acyrthosiphon pisum]|uniref:Uncharacterized protein n=1 Tax=Acyrthosiphon pisum TaxID=7029 RepID=A0A8R1W1M7_ACYPI|nr:uncharacterized protein LOC100159791 [Acyrthosiphon pisum]|eukprot:XP_001948681.1 PREDICTED: uncharacterized protein LOC100159791 [Acyrthosiphon pisum]